MNALIIVFSLLHAPGGVCDGGWSEEVEPGDVRWRDTVDAMHLRGTRTRRDEDLADAVVAGQ